MEGDAGSGACAVSPSASCCPVEHLMTPQPIIPPHLHEAERLKTAERRLEVENDVLGPFRILVRREAAEDVAARPEGRRQSVDGLHRIREMLEDVHRGDHIEGLGGRVPDVLRSRICPLSPR